MSYTLVLCFSFTLSAVTNVYLVMDKSICKYAVDGDNNLDEIKLIVDIFIICFYYIFL